MHIAICDDNIADRKHLERLLMRESDRRAGATGVLYVDAFGNEESLLKTPMQYDLFFIDMIQSSCSGMEVAWKLRDAGVVAPIVMCSSRIDYSLIVHQPPIVLHLSKQVKTEQLIYILDSAISKAATTLPTMEVRGDQETLYLHPDSIYWIKISKNKISIHMDDGTIKETSGTFAQVLGCFQGSDFFVSAGSRFIFNCNYISKVSPTKVTLFNGTQIRVSLSEGISLKQKIEI